MPDSQTLREDEIREIHKDIDKAAQDGGGFRRLLSDDDGAFQAGRHLRKVIVTRRQKREMKEREQGREERSRQYRGTD